MSEAYETGPASLWKLSTVNPQRVTMRTIASDVAQKHNLRLKDIVGPERARMYSRPRQEAMHAIYSTGRYSLPQIGAFFGGRDHTTVLHGVRAHEARTAG